MNEDITVSHGLSLGLFIVVASIIVCVFISITVIQIGQIMDYKSGRMQFSELGGLAKWIVLTFFNDDGDGYA